MMRSWKIPCAYLRMFETTIIIITIISKISLLLDRMSEFNHNYFVVGYNENGALDLNLKISWTHAGKTPQHQHEGRLA